MCVYVCMEVGRTQEVFAGEGKGQNTYIFDHALSYGLIDILAQNMVYLSLICFLPAFEGFLTRFWASISFASKMASSVS